MMSHHHFSLEDRQAIQNGLEDNKSYRTIADKLGVAHTAIGREVRRNSVVLEIVTTTRVNRPRILMLDLRTRRGKGEVPEKWAARVRYQKRLARFARSQPAYVATIAHTMYLERRAIASQSNYVLRDGEPLAEMIASLLLAKTKDSPEQIVANLAKESTNVSYHTIYRWIRRSSQSAELTARLRRRGKRYRYQATTVDGWNKTSGKRSIHKRPVVIEELTRYGDLEGDTIFGQDSKDRILTHVDRVTGLLSLSLVTGYDSHKIHQQTLTDLDRMFGGVGKGIRTITYDNGSEFAAWQLTEGELKRQAKDKRVKAKIYFADPYRSSQRGRNENTNGLVRDYFPKGTDFKTITRHDLQEVEDILNNRSRKRYDWRSPFEQRAYVLDTT